MSLRPWVSRRTWLLVVLEPTAFSSSFCRRFRREEWSEIFLATALAPASAGLVRVTRRSTDVTAPLTNWLRL